MILIAHFCILSALSESVLSPHKCTPHGETLKERRVKKKENAAANTARNATGNIIEVPSVSNVALRVLDAIGQDCSVGIGPEETNIWREVIVATDEPIITIETEVAPHDYAESSPLRATRVRRRQRSGQPRQQQPPVAFLNMQQEHNNLLQHQNVLLNRLNDTVEGNSYTGYVFKIRAERRRNLSEEIIY
ncbi:uncharacterized protein LOC125491273 [Plutella xylostella]|uniref:uncharacterized protein LOC125491273 n=1 Tax=Plutella xylostella TaxID=51655 RepID=UPI0020326E4D|nr:uncharacterized protein LOC125491273 [Plutella xylostella]